MSRSGRRTPLRRVSQGSLVGLRHSQAFAGPTGLEYLEPILSDIADEQEQLLRNMEDIDTITEHMENLANDIAGYLQAMRINAYCVDWQEASYGPVGLAAAGSNSLIWQYIGSNRPLVSPCGAKSRAPAYNS